LSLLWFALILAAQDTLPVYVLPVPEALREPVAEQRWKDVLLQAERLRSESSGDPVLSCWSGIAQLRLKKNVQAVMHLRTAQKLGLRNATVLKTLGLAYYGLSQYHLFLQQMTEASRLEPGDFEPYFYLGRYYAYVMSDFGKALTLFDQAAARNPEELTTLHFRAVCLQALNRIEEAKRAFLDTIQKLEARGQRYSWPYQRLAELLLTENENELSIDDALKHAMRAVEIDGENDLNHATLAKALEKRNDLTGALRHRQQAASLNPTEPSTHYLLARLYQRLGNTAKAKEELAVHSRLRKVYGSKRDR
jgi:tetratricopeptide (TPR) repeat protein